MKILVFVFVTLFAFSYQGIPDTINEYIEQLKEAIPEPISIVSLNIDLSGNENLSGYLNVSNLNIQGIKAFDMDITYVLNLIPTNFVLTFNSIKLDLDYLTDIALGDIILHVFGEGKGSVELTNFVVKGNLTVSLVPKNATISGMEMHLDDAKFTFSGLLNDDTFSKELNDLLDNYVAKLFNEFEGELSTVLEDTLNKAIQDILAANSTSETYDRVAVGYIKDNYNVDIYDLGEVFELAAEKLFSVLGSILPKMN